MKWNKKSEKIPENTKQLTEIILENRGIPKSAIEEFLNPMHPEKLKNKAVGFDTKQFTAAVAFIKKAIIDDEKIVIFGDYDVDGICASAILWQVLFKLYKIEHPEGLNHPVPFIPHREKHGYGISQTAIEEIIESHDPKIIITVDNGVVAHEAIAYARQKGIAVVLTDHHQPEYIEEKPIFPSANCVVHTTQLCGATVAWMLARALDLKLASQLLDLAGIATIADQVPLLGANRSFAKFGINALQVSNNVGISALCKAAGIVQSEISEGTVGFVIAPRINAMGRLEHGLDALRLLCTRNKKQAEDLATVLNDTNVSRQDMTKQMLDLAQLQAEQLAEEHILIVFSEEFHEGILGLIAGGLVEKFHKPAIAITRDAGLAKASARSVFGVNIVDMLREIKQELVSVGGHPMAAGFSFLPENLDTIKMRLFEIAKESISKEHLEKSLAIDCQIPVSLVSADTVVALLVFAPYGMKNPQPVFEISDLTIQEIKSIGKDKEHIKLRVCSSTDEMTPAFDCLGWRMNGHYSQLKVGDTVTIVGTVDINEWRNKQFPQVIIRDIKAK